MAGETYVRTYSPPPCNREEILRYAGVRESTPELNTLLEECLQAICPQLTYKVCWQEFPIFFSGDTLDLGFTRTDSISLRRALHGCSRALVFAATVGFAPDRFIARFGKSAPSKAFLFQAIGTERVESLCDTFCTDIATEAKTAGLRTTTRFSPGYGDLPLTLQQDLFRVLDCPRKIGVSLSQSLLMTPAKSVTAIIGICSADPDCVHRRSI